MDGVNKTSKTNFNLSKYPNNLINLLVFCFIFWILAIMIYSLYLKYNENILILAVFGPLLWGLWDFFPIVLHQDGYKYWPIYFYDMFVTGFFCFGLTGYLYKNYYNLLSENIYILAILYISLYLIFFYEWFIYNRKGTKNNWLVKLGDKLLLYKILPYIRLQL